MTKNIFIAIYLSVGLVIGSIIIAPKINIDASTNGSMTTTQSWPCPPKPGGSSGSEDGTVSRDSKPRRGGNSSSYINKEDLRARLTEKLRSSKLNGYVPSDGALYGITTGSPEQWANYLTELAGRESSYNNNTVGDIGLFDGNSNGLFQLSPNDAVNYKLNGGKPFTQDQLRDADTNMSAAISIHESLVIKANSIRKGAGRYWGPVQRGWLPYIPPGIPSSVTPTVPSGGGATSGENGTPEPYDQCWCVTDPAEKAKCQGQVPVQQSSTFTTNYGGSPLWQTSPNCYKHQGNPSGPMVYYNALTCNGGYKFDSDWRPYYVPDCGVNNSVGCNEFISRLSGYAGCLWAICKNGNNAIWDPGTRRCGCDDGKMSTATIAMIYGEETGDYIQDTNTVPGEIGPAPAPGTMSEKIYNQSKLALEEGLSTCKVAGTEGGALGCASAVSTVLQRAGVEGVGTLGTAELNRQLERSGRFVRISGFAESMPGDIVVSPTQKPGPGNHGHTGIIMSAGGTQIASNGGGFYKINYNNVRWLERMDSRGIPTYIWRPID